MKEIAPKYEMTFGSADRLGPFTNRFRFFTPALPYVHGRFEDRHLLEFLGQHPRPVRLLYHRFERRIFRGFHTPDGDAGWNHALWAVEAESYKALENFMLSVAVIDGVTRTLYKIGATDVLLLDPLYADRSPVLAADAPVLPVVVFGVDGSNACVCVDPVSDRDKVNPLGPALRFMPPQPSTVAAAERIFCRDDPGGLLPELPIPPIRGPLVLPALRGVESLSPAKRAELLRDVERYKKGF